MVKTSNPHYSSLQRHSLLALAICLLAFGICHALTSYGQVAYAQTSAPLRHTTTKSQSITTTKTSIPLPANVIVPKKPVAAAISTPNCVANTQYGLPGPLSLANAPTGLTLVTDMPAYYDVFGSTVAQIAQELNACAPHFSGTVDGANYLAYTSYKIGWQYNTATQADGLCSLTNIKVGQHSSQIFPRWNSTITAPADISVKWTNFINALTLHESGHLALNSQYAQKLLTDLQALPAMPCAGVAAAANTVVQTDVAALNAAHLAHDTATGYGASEGAIW